ncbi:glycosyltransferase family 4 protein [Mediterraneibacter glycyrrhizinilyticus]|uniref:glycosyltransferase family 4 protein n=1 Tax=Mediterraneibacter glycyrrhizinilyticus TaxID=342942 RepID=UPI0025A4305A|nr:glycosyltransferase family 4 protein [Mediterraneibacter glycyrrhizinilyticus]MDM8209870.1 glycosyltransferase family 4 protein [Mediterraneibacter glycyrrhizinilyticus]
MKKVIVAHPGKQHSYRTAKYLNESGRLVAYVTSVYNMPGGLTHILYRLAKGNIKKKIGSHYLCELPDNVVKIRKEWQGVLALILPKIPLIRNCYGMWNNHLNDIFAKDIIKLIENESADLVISYDYNSAYLFEELNRRGSNVIKVLDVSIAIRPYMQEMFKIDYEHTQERELVSDYPEIWDERNLRRVYRELENTDFFLVPSQVVKNSLLYCGVEEKKIRVVPYGADCSKFDFVKREVPTGPIKLIFVGGINHRKGIHHLLSVVSKFSADEVDLKLVGSYDVNGSLYKRYNHTDNIHFCGFATHDILVNMYHDSDVFVLPSLGEGMAMVILEAMSCGLPVIVSDRTGGNDAITAGEEGIEIEAGNDEQLYDAIRWYIDNRNCLPEMSIKARKKAELYSWDAYGEKLNCVVSEILGD